MEDLHLLRSPFRIPWSHQPVILLHLPQSLTQSHQPKGQPTNLLPHLPQSHTRPRPRTRRHQNRLRHEIFRMDHWHLLQSLLRRLIGTSDHPVWTPRLKNRRSRRLVLLQIPIRRLRHLPPIRQLHLLQQQQRPRRQSRKLNPQRKRLSQQRLHHKTYQMDRRYLLRSQRQRLRIHLSQPLIRQLTKDPRLIIQKSLRPIKSPYLIQQKSLRPTKGQRLVQQKSLLLIKGQHLVPQRSLRPIKGQHLVQQKSPRPIKSPRLVQQKSLLLIKGRHLVQQ